MVCPLSVHTLIYGLPQCSSVCNNMICGIICYNNNRWYSHNKRIAQHSVWEVMGSSPIRDELFSISEKFRLFQEKLFSSQKWVLLAMHGWHFCGNLYKKILYEWVSAWKMLFQWVSNGVTSFLYQPIDMGYKKISFHNILIVSLQHSKMAAIVRAWSVHGW